METPWRSRGYVPHCDLMHAVQSITFRLDDALPPEERGITAPDIERDRLEEVLDTGYGSCALRLAENADLVQNALLHGDVERYRLLAWCIMPNHVHVMIEMRPEWPLNKILQSWKSYSGRRIKFPSSRAGARRSQEEPSWSSATRTIWQREYWDRFIRDDHHFQTCLAYIENNPVKAGLVSRKSSWPWSSASTASRSSSSSTPPGTAELQLGSNRSSSSSTPPGTAELQLGSNQTISDHHCLLRAFRQASFALGTTAPNPGVGCVIVRDGVLLGEGHTGPSTITPQIHAEAAALADAKQRGYTTGGATAYVTLAPCTKRSVAGTACSDHLIAAGITRVVIGAEDPHQAESSAYLTAAGITVVHAGAAIATHVHGGFLKRITEKRPRFTGKWAQTLDGFMATESGHSGWISSPLALELSRRRRRAFDAILVGSGTARADNPRLLASRTRTKPLLRIVLNAKADIADDAAMLQTLDQAPLLVVHHPDADTARLRGWGVDLLAVADPHDLAAVARSLGALGLNDILVEGGAAIHGAFLRAQLYDRLEIYQGGTTLAGGRPVSRGPGAPTIPDGQHWLPECPPMVLGHTILTRWRLPQ